MKRLALMIIPALICGMVFTSCGSKVAIDDGGDDEYYKATVRGKGLDCGNNIFMIQFDEEVTSLPISLWINFYYALDLPEEYKTEGKRIEVQFRLPKVDEMIACNAMGLALPHIFIVKVRCLME